MLGAYLQAPVWVVRHLGWHGCSEERWGGDRWNCIATPREVGWGAGKSFNTPRTQFPDLRNKK